MSKVSSRDSARSQGDAEFVGSIPDVYERLLVPLIFAEPAEHLAAAVAALQPHDLLETAAGTGVVTRALRASLPSASLTATDLSESMLDEARARSGPIDVTWQQADAHHLEFADDAFDVVVTQFGVMFFERAAAYAEVRRVLRPGGAYAFNVWGGLADNEVPAVVAEAVAALAAEDPPDFFGRTPYGYFDHARIVADLAAAGFDAEVEDCDGTNRATARDAAIALCQGTPLRSEIEAHPGLDLAAATDAATEALERRFGDGVFAAPSRWIQVFARPR